MDKFEVYAKGYYSKNGKPTDRYLKYMAAVRFLKPFHDVLTNDFKHSHLRQIQTEMVNMRPHLNRTTINTYMAAIKKVFHWGTENYDLVDASVYAPLLSVKNVLVTDGRAKNSAGVEAVDDADLVALLDKIGEPHKTILMLQYLTGARPGEIVSMRAGEIDISEKIWVYQPDHHKTAHLKKKRLIALSAEAQELLKPYMPADGVGHLFQHAGKPYTPDSLRKAIQRTCRKHKLVKFNPNQIRHRVATLLRDKDGLDAAQAMLGHNKIDMTQHYAKVSKAKISEIAESGMLSLKGRVKQADDGRKETPNESGQAPELRLLARHENTESGLVEECYVNCEKMETLHDKKYS